MNLTLTRKTFTNKSTIGELATNGKFECYTLEDVPRNIKIDHRTCIPYGMYQVIITFSERFQKPMPLLLNVQNFEGVRIHSGNTAEDTEGCILVGTTKEVDFIGNSRAAYKVLFRKLQSANKAEKMWLEIKKG
jgi:hypothetical protein